MKEEKMTGWDIELVDAKEEDREIFYQIKKATCEKYVDMYFGGWKEDEQRKMNDDIFDQSLEQTCFKMIKVDGQPVGFFGYTINDREIGCVTLQITDIKERSVIFECLLDYLSELAKKHRLPIFAKSFLASKDINMYENAGFKIMSKNNSHYLLMREKEKEMLSREDYEKLVETKFADKEETKNLMLQQINNFYDVAGKEFQNKNYHLKEEVKLDQNTLMTGFRYNLDYLKLIAQEGKICGDYAGIDSGHGVHWAISTWKFTQETTLKDHIMKYSGITVADNGQYEIIPFGNQTKKMLKQLKKNTNPNIGYEYTREQRFLPNDVNPNENIALIFNVGHDGCEKLINNELQQDFMPNDIRVGAKQNNSVEVRDVMDKALGDRAAYIMFGIPRNCIEGIFVNRKLEKDKQQLAKIKELFPDCYICNIDGKVIAVASERVKSVDKDDQEKEF